MKMDRKTTRGLSESNTGERSDSTANGKGTKRKKPSDVHFASIIDRINEGFVALDAQMNYTYINQRGSELLKRKPEDLIGKNYWDEYPEDKNTSFGQAYLRALDTQTSIEIEDYYAPGDRWLQNRIFPFEDGLSIFFNDITERKLAEEKMRQSEERFRQAADAVGALVYEVDLRSGATAIVHGMETVIGYDPQKTEMTSDWWHSLIHPDDLPAHLSQLDEHLAKGGTHISEYRVQHKNGKWITVQDNRLVIQDSEGKAIRLIGAVTDITEPKRTQLALTEFARQQQALYLLSDRLQRTKSLQDVFDAALDAILRALQCDRTSILLFDETNVMHFVAWRGLSDDYRKATDGHSPWKPDEKNPQPISMNDIRTADLSNSLRTVIEKEGIGSLAFIPLVSSGKLIGKFMSYFNTPHVFNEDEIDLSLTIARQLTLGIDGKRDEQALRESEERFRNLANTMPSIVWIAAPDGTITYANNQWFQYAGITPEANARQWPELVLHPDDYERCVSEWTRAVETVPDEYLIEVRNRRYDGQYRWFQTRAVPVRDSTGKATAWYGVTTDIHDRKEAERRLVLLANISEVLRKIEDPQELMYAVAKAVGEHLQVKRCLFNETDLEADREIVYNDYFNGVPSAAGIHKISDYSSITSAEMMAGKTVINYDSKSDPRTAQDYERTYAPNKERAYIAVPLMRENQWVGTLWVSDDMPRQWSPEEVSLLETVAERTWTVVEKLRINADLRQSEERYRFIVENTSDGIWHIQLTEPMAISLPEEEQLDWYYEHAVIRQCNLGLARMYGYDSVEQVLGLPMRDIMPRKNPVNLELSRQFIRSGYRLVDAESREVNREGRELVFLNNMIGVIEDGKLTGEWGTNRDITERKRMEDERNQLLQREQTLRANAEQAKAEAERELTERKMAEAALGQWVEMPLPHETRPAWMRYGMAIAITALALLLRVALQPFIGDSWPLVTLFGAVAFSVWFGGIGPALLSMIMGYFGAAWFVIEPLYAITLDVRNITGLGLFLFSNTVIIALGQAMRLAQRHAHQSARVAVERKHQVEIQLLERQQTEASLRQSEALYRAIARSIPGGGVYVVDKDFRYLVAEGPVTEAFGLSRERLEGHTVSEVFSPEPAERMEARLQRNFAGETVDFETEYNGRVYWTQQAPMMDAFGNMDNAIIMTIDITERKQVEEALRRSEERFVRFMQHLPGLAWIKDSEGRYVYANAAAEKAFRTPREKLYGRRDEDIFPAEFAAQFTKNDELALMDEKGVQVTETLEHEDGVLHYSLVSKFPIPGPDGNTALIGGTAIDITERKQAEEALRESEARLRAVFDGTYEYIGLLAPDGTLLEANRAALEFDNDTREEVVGRPFWETNWWIHTPGAPEALHQAIIRGAAGEFIRYEAPLKRRSGETIIFDFSLHPVRDEQGQVVYLVPEGRNITDRKQAEEALRESEERFRAILGQATAGIVHKDTEGRFIFVNEAFCNMLGYTEAELMGKTIWQLTHEDDLEENKQLYDRAVMEGIPFKLEKRLLRKNGSIIWVDVSVSPIMDATGTPQSAVAVEVDITGRKQAEKALLESERRFREMINALPAAIYTTDAEGWLTHFNPAAAEFSGRVPVIGTDQWCVSWKLYYPDGRPMPHDECPMAIALKEGKVVRGVEAIAERPDGKRVWFEPYPTPLRDSEGRIVGGINMLVDITQRKKAEEELQQLNLQLESRVEKRTIELQAANQSLRDEIAERLKAEDALHESRKRLQILSQRLVDVQEEERRAIARELHDRVGQSLSALNINLVILDNQISSHATQQIRTRMDDSIQLVAETITLVRDVMSDLRPPVLDDYGLEAALQSHVDAFKSRYGIDVQFEKSEQPIPRLGASLEMTVLRIAQEALSNVARHAQAEKVTLSLIQEPKVVRLVVQDNGTGIISWQEANRTGSHGLTIMRERAEAVGGDLKVSSVPGKGTKVEASIPFESGDEENIQKERHE